MLYEIAHVVKDKCSLLWDIFEWINSQIFYSLHKKSLKQIPILLKEISNDTFYVRMTTEDDASKLAEFFKEQPNDAYKFFKPHDFDEKTVLKIIKNKTLLTFIVLENNNIVGYFFLRCYVNGKCFRGKIVHKDWRRRGLAKLMGFAMTKVAICLNLRMFGSISPENYASMASAKASNDIKILKTLDNGYYYIEFLPKKI